LQSTPPAAAESPKALHFVPLANLAAQQVRDLGRLSPGALGTLLVAPNAVSITDAWQFPGATLWGVLETQGDQATSAGRPVGLLLIYDASVDAQHAKSEGHAPDCLYLWRLSIGFDHQGKGYGLAAMKHAIAYARKRPGVTHVTLSHVDQPGHAGPFYESLGFKYTGKVDEDAERYMRLDLS
jgi:diamine N-acetyltransferase